MAAFIREINFASFATQHKIGAKGVHLSWLSSDPTEILHFLPKSQFTFEEQNLAPIASSTILILSNLIQFKMGSSDAGLIDVLNLLFVLRKPGIRWPHVSNRFA